MNLDSLMTPFSTLRPQRGAILLIVLVSIMVLTLMIAAASRLIDGKIETAKFARESANDIVLTKNKIAELQYVVATHPLNSAGFLRRIPNNPAEIQSMTEVSGREIKVNGTFNEDSNGLRYSIQASTGLLPINSADQFWLRSFLINSGASLSDVNRLLDGLYDYADANSRPKPLGHDQKKTPINQFEIQTQLHPNYLLQTCGELFNIKVWRDYPLTQSVVDVCSVSRIPSLNLNSIPKRLFMRLFPNAERGPWETEKGVFSNDKAVLNSITEIISVPDEYYSLLLNEYFILNVSIGNYTQSAAIRRGVEKIPPILPK